MKKAVAIVFLALYVFNLAGYYAVFKAMQYRVRSGIKTMIKESVPQGELVLIVVSPGERDKLQWLDEREFRYRGGMYDIVRQYSRNDTAFYSCVNDVQEERLFANLDLHVATQSNLEGLPKKAASVFAGIAKEYIPLSCILPNIPFEFLPAMPHRDFNVISHIAEVPTPPPRIT